MVESTEVARQQIAAFNVTSPAGAPLIEELVGQYRGEQVEPSSESSKIANAAEELGMAVASRSDRKNLGQRQVRQDGGMGPEALARLRDFYEKLPDMPSEAKLQDLVQRLGDYLRSGEGSAAEVLAELQRFDGDVTHQYAALEVLEAALAGQEAAAPVLLAVRASYERAEVMRDIRAGIAAAEIAHEMAATLETDPAAVRDAYRAMLRDAGDYARVFDVLSRFDVLKSLPEAIKTFMEAAGRDLSAAGPSVDPVQLQHLLSELGKLKKVQTTLSEADGLIRTTSRLVTAEERALLGDAVQLTGRLLAFASKLVVSPGDARQLMGAMLDGAPASQVALANGLRGLHGNLADEIMPGPAARLQQAETLVELLEERTAHEESEFARLAAQGGG